MARNHPTPDLTGKRYGRLIVLSQAGGGDPREVSPVTPRKAALSHQNLVPAPRGRKEHTMKIGEMIPCACLYCGKPAGLRRIMFFNEYYPNRVSPVIAEEFCEDCGSIIGPQDEAALTSRELDDLSRAETWENHEEG